MLAAAVRTVRVGNFELVKMLVDYGADVNIPAKIGPGPVHVVAQGACLTPAAPFPRLGASAARWSTVV